MYVDTLTVGVCRMKYIEEELEKKKKQEKGHDGGDEDGQEKKYHSPEEAALLAVPETLRTSSGERSEEMLSHQMLSGIPEVDLGIEWVPTNFLIGMYTSPVPVVLWLLSVKIMIEN